MPSRWTTSANRPAERVSATPSSWRRVPAGLVRGPSRLNAVRTPISRRVGAAWRIAGWKFGANRNAKPMSRRADAADAESWSMRMPSASSTSADPAREVIARLPCFATGTPAAATTRAAAVEMLKVPLPSPPVPTTSMVPGGASTGTTRSRMAVAKPASSSTVSPRMRRPISRAASWAAVASPSITAPIARRASSSESVPPSTIVASAPRTWSLIDRPPLARPAVAKEPLAASRRDASPSPARRRKLASRCGPWGVSTLSGWNWTPSSGSATWRMPMTTRSASLMAVTRSSSGSVAGSTASE